MLERNDFPNSYWKGLGRQLGLDDETLDDIHEEYGTLKKCFRKCMHTWLKGEDSEKQFKTWETLLNALYRIGLKEVADKIRSDNYY